MAVGADNSIRAGGQKYKARFTRGGSFCLDVPPGVPSVWGDDSQVLWAKGEPLLLVGPDGVGKTTVGQQLVLGMLGIKTEVLGLHVQEVEKVLYLAIDRWRQAQRSFHRMVTEEERPILDSRLVVLRGSLPVSLDKEPGILSGLAMEAKAGVVIVDSLKDAARKISSDETGSAVADAFRFCEDEGIEVMANHHQRKQGKETGPPVTLDDVYGSRLIPAASGSVALLWGKPGDPVVKLKHLKQPAEEVGPWEVLHDHAHGVSTRILSVDLVILAGSNGGLTARTAAVATFGTDKPSKNDVERARQRLASLVKRGTLVKVEQNGEAVYKPMEIDFSDD